MQMRHLWANMNLTALEASDDCAAIIMSYSSLSDSLDLVAVYACVPLTQDIPLLYVRYACAKEVET